MLNEVDIIAAEDTRHTLKLLNHLQIKKTLVSYYKEIEKVKSELLIKKILAGKNIAVVSDAGTPGISDPGEEIIKTAIQNGVQIVPIPGACALINALIISNISTKEFCFLGFLSTNKKEKILKLNEIINYKQTLIFYEAPHKIVNTLQSIKEVLGNRRVILAREITKIHEEFIYGVIDEVLDKLSEPKGEFVIIVEGAKNSKIEETILELSSLSLEEHFKYYEEMGYEKKDIIKHIAKDRHVSKNEIYKHFMA